MIVENSSTNQKTAFHRKNQIVVDERMQDSPVANVATASLPSSFISMNAFWMTFLALMAGKSTMPEKFALSVNISPRPNYK